MEIFLPLFAELRSELLAEAKGKILKPEEVKSVIQDIIQPAVNNTREYQSLCAKVYCNRKSLLPKGEKREEWEASLMDLKKRLIS